MRHILKHAVLAAILTVGAVNARALQFIDYDGVPTYLNADGSPGAKKVTGTFSITPPYNPATDDLLSAEVFFYYSDDDPPDAILGDGPFWGDGEEFVRLRLDNGKGGWKKLLEEEVGVLDNASEALPKVAFNSLSADGVLDYEVKATTGDFWFLGAKLVVEIAPKSDNTAGVPDGGMTLALLGLSLAGVGALRHKL